MQQASVYTGSCCVLSLATARQDLSSFLRPRRNLHIFHLEVHYVRFDQPPTAAGAFPAGVAGYQRDPADR